MADTPDRLTIAAGGEQVQYIRADMVVGEPVGELRARLNQMEVAGEDLRREYQTLRQQRDELQASHALRVSELEHFKTLVREVAIKVAEENNWCDNGLNEVLVDELGLEPKNRRYRVTVRVFAYQDVETEVSADSREHAQELVLQDDNMNELWRDLEQQAWEADSMAVNEPEIRDVTQLSS